MSEQQALIDALHAERTEAGTTNIDCWACEASRSKAIADLMTALRRAQSALGATRAVLDRAVPDEAEQKALWGAFWRERIATEYGLLDGPAVPAVVDVPLPGDPLYRPGRSRANDGE